MKLTAANCKELAKLNPAVAAKIDSYATRYRTRNVRYNTHPAGWRMYLAEGTDYTIFAPNSNMAHTRMISGDTIGAANDGMNYHVGQFTPPLPEGTWIVEFDLFLGKPFIFVYYIGLSQLTV